MKVVIPVADLHTGGGCKVLAEVANALVRRGHSTEMVIPMSGRVNYDLDCNITRVPTLSKEYIPYGDIILPNFYTTFRPAFEAWPKQCVRFSLGFEPLWVPNRAEALWTYKQGVPIFTISHWLDDQIQRMVNQKSRVINLGIDPDTFFPKQEEAKNNGKKVILYIARDPKSGYELKGFNDFVNTMQIVRREYKGDFIVHLICPENTLTIPDIPCRTFKPKDAMEMAELYRSADVFVSTSWFEGFSLPPLESMASGTPVVTTNSGGVMDFCQHHKNAYITRPKDARSIATGIINVLSNPKLAEILVKGGLETARKLTKQNFETTIVKALETIHQEMKGQGKK
jgi:glycosyltransferase involved in cell wall biosynthesis